MKKGLKKLIAGVFVDRKQEEQLKQLSRRDRQWQKGVEARDRAVEALLQFDAVAQRNAEAREARK